MVSLTTVVLLACACVAIEALRPLRQQCMKIRKGSTQGFTSYVKPIILSKKVDYWEKELPNCLLGKTNGVDVQACSEEKIPELKFVGNSTVILRRSGKESSYIVVVINLICDIPQPGDGEIKAQLLNL